MPVFLAPWLLLAAAAALVPVGLHLLWRRKPRAVPFSTLRFLREAVVRTRHSRRLTQLLLLSLRVLILLCLALAFAQPKLALPRAGGGGGQQRTALIILDASASMQFRHGAESAFDLARQRAETVLASLGESDKAALLVPGLPEPAVVLPPTADKAKLRAALAALAPGQIQADFATSLANWLETPPAGLEPRDLEIHVCSDFQQSSWPLDRLPTLAERLRRRQPLLFLNQVRPEAIANAGIRQASFQPAAAFAAEPVRATVQIATTPDWDGTVSATLLFNGSEQDTRPAPPAPPGERQTLILHGATPDTGTAVAATIRLGDDAFAPDNRHYAVLPRDAGIPVWLVRDRPAESLFAEAAIQPGGTASQAAGFRLETLTWAELAAREPPPGCLLVLCNPPPPEPAVLQKVEALLAAGSSVLLFPGDAGGLVDPGFRGWAVLAGLGIAERAAATAEPVVLLPRTQPTDVEKRLRSIVAAPPTFPISRRLLFRHLPATAEAVLEYPDRTPFLVGLPHGTGQLWLGSVAADRGWSDFPLTPFFLILQQEILRTAAARLHPPLETVAGGSLALPWAEPLLEATFELTPPAGGPPRRRPSRRRTPAEPFVLSGFSEPGIWTVSRDGITRQVAVNTPPEEAELDYAGLDTFTTRFAPLPVLAARTAAEQGRNLQLARFGRPLWPWLLAATFLAALAELGLANRPLGKA